PSLNHPASRQAHRQSFDREREKGRTAQRPHREGGRNTVTAPQTRHTGTLLAVLLAAPFLAQADATIANVATPAIRADLGASGASAELVIGGYLVAYAVLLLTGARLGQTHDYTRLFLAGIAVFGTASLACGLATSPVMLIA